MAWAGSQDRMAAFEERHGLTFPSLYDPDGEVFARFGVPGQPAWVFVRPDGQAARRLGAIPDAELDQVLADLTAA